MARLGLLLQDLELSNLCQLSVDTRSSRFRKFEDAAYSMTEEEMINTYRVDHATVMRLVDELDPYLARVRSNGLSPLTKILAALAFYATGSLQRGIGQLNQHCIAQTTVSKCIREVTAALNREEILQKYLKFPETQNERNNIKEGFYEKFCIPGVLGCIDVTQVAISKSIVARLGIMPLYTNNKDYYSVNVQVICDSDMNIMSVDTSPGSLSHSRTWERHAIRQHIAELHQAEPCWFLGDEAYAQRKWMMTPFRNTIPHSAEAYYNQQHKIAHSTVKKTMEALKSRWRCLLVSQPLFYSPAVTGDMIRALGVLHNIANAANLPVPELTEEDLSVESEKEIFHIHREKAEVGHLFVRGRDMRDLLVRNMFEGRENVRLCEKSGVMVAAD